MDRREEVESSFDLERWTEGQASALLDIIFLSVGGSTSKYQRSRSFVVCLVASCSSSSALFYIISLWFPL